MLGSAVISVIKALTPKAFEMSNFASKDKVDEFKSPLVKIVDVIQELKEKQKETTRDKSDSNRRYVLIGEAYNSGETIQSLMERYHVTQGTILGHMTRYLSAGNTLRKGEDLQKLTSTTTEQQKAIFTVFDELSPTFLKPVYEKLNGKLNYDELKILRMLYMIFRQE